MRKIHLIQIITFLSAFLLFQIELLIGKVFLPNFGGSFMVWGACVVFFQAVFLLGYKYAQYVIDHVGIHRYRRWHCLLAFLPLLAFPGRTLPLTFTPAPLPMMFAVFWQLCLVIGLVFFVLTTTSVIWQVWLFSSNLPERKNPYALFAISNYGSFAALLSYPFYFELQFSLVTQQYIWRVGYLLFVALQWWALRTIDVRQSKERKVDLKPVKLQKAVSWACYAAAGVMMFLAVTNIMTSEIAPVPLLWIVPLMIYLVSFVLNFKKKPYCPKWLKEEFHLLVGVGVVSYFIIQSPVLPMALNILLLCVLTYYVCMYAQYRLYREKPDDTRYLPFYYLMISLGSFLGGVLVTWVIPAVATTFVEYFSGFLVMGVAFFLQKKGKQNPYLYIGAGAVIALLFWWPQIFNQEALRFTPLQFGALLALMVTVALIFSGFKNNALAMLVCLALCMGLSQKIEAQWNQADYIYQQRNYYGISRIAEDDQVRTFLHGKTIHGAQYKDEAKASIPLSYYGYDSPIGVMLKKDQGKTASIGIIGLGVGTLSTYFQDSWHVDYFELEEDVYDMARTHFSFLKNARGEVHYYMGDGRLLLQERADQKYDLLIADAFSGDSIPIHLMTQEALELYKRKMKDHGVLLFHISNRYIDVTLPLFKTAQSIGASVSFKEGKGEADYTEESFWVALTWSEARLKSMTTVDGWLQARAMDPDIRVWTDVYNSVLPFIYYDELLYDLRSFFYYMFKK